MNIEAIKRLAKKLRRLRHEDHYDQGVYGEKTACGTAACLAGHAVLLGGGRLIYPKAATWTDTCAIGEKGRTVSIHAAARKLLGLLGGQADTLFADDPAYYWPGDFGDRWERVQNGESDERPSRIAADLLDAIADGKVKL